MKIFYGVQGTGNGHITRARVMAEAFSKTDYSVDYLFTGRPRDQFFEMQGFGDYRWRTGLTFNTGKGRVNYIKTGLQSHPIKFICDLLALDFSSYDLVISDFEPITAWAAKANKVPVLGIGHQYAFNFDIPKIKGDILARNVMKYYAPASQSLGLHWHHFGQPILPPIIEPMQVPEKVQPNKIILYLPFENQQQIIKLFTAYKDYLFFLYSPDAAQVSKVYNITIKPLSRTGFQQDFHDAAGVISNAGFELASEALQLGKKILVKPLTQQMEQISNALALDELGYGRVMKQLDPDTIADWLGDNNAVRVTYSNTADAIVDWIGKGMEPVTREWIQQIWQDVKIIKLQRDADSRNSAVS